MTEELIGGKNAQERYSDAVKLFNQYFDPACEQAYAEIKDLSALSIIEGLLTSAYAVVRLQSDHAKEGRKATFLAIAEWIADCVENETAGKH